MALTGTGAVLGAAMKSAVDGLTDEQKQDRDEVFKAMGEAIIAHIIANGVAAVFGVTTGGGVANIV
jgi:hypothetical protein